MDMEGERRDDSVDFVTLQDLSQVIYTFVAHLNNRRAQIFLSRDLVAFFISSVETLQTPGDCLPFETVQRLYASGHS